MTFQVIRNFSKFFEGRSLSKSACRVGKQVKRKKREAWADTTPEEKVRTLGKPRSYD